MHSSSWCQIVTRFEGQARLAGVLGGWLVVAASVLLVGCAHRAAAAEHAAPDQPVPPTESRETLGFVVQLKPGPSCEEEFDLALYAHRGVDLIQWDGRTGQCRDRQVQIRYLPRRIGREELIQAVQRHTAKAVPKAQNAH